MTVAFSVFMSALVIKYISRKNKCWSF